MKKLLLLLLLTAMGSFAVRACTAGFTYINSNPNPPGVYFINHSIGDSSGAGITYAWDFGDGGTSTTADPFHPYASNGTYTVCLHIIDNSGCQDSTCQSVVVTTPAPTISTWLMTDSMSMYTCIAPASVTWYYSATTQGFTSPDTVFDVQVIWGDGTDSTWQVTGMNPGLQGTIHHMYINTGTYTAQLNVSGANGTVTSSSTGQPVTVAATCGSVAGHVYNDINNNCVFDAGEELANIPLTIWLGTQLVAWTQTDAYGVYSFNVPTGSTYTINVQPHNGFNGNQTPSCPASGSLTISSVPSTGNDFGLSCPPGADITGSVYGWRFRPGFTTSVCVYAYNARCQAASGQIEITLDPNLTPLPDTGGIGYTINGQVVTFPLANPATYWSFCFPVQVSATAQIGDSVCIGLNIIATGDSDLSNNTGNYCFAVSNSFDPNDKSVSPQGAILPNTPLTYTIRFQNTGNDVAYNIYILDTLDADLDVTSFELIASSHPVTYSVLAGNIVRFNFDNIMLADSNANEAASHGYVSYRINEIQSVANGVPINNSASIYFDFNSPIYTNTTTNNVDYFLAVPVTPGKSDFAIYPNPASNNLSIRFADNTSRKISITDAVGKIVFSTIANDILNINAAKFANGVYNIRVIEGSSAQTRKLIINHN